ncbi:hypothetical protein BAUCODRAFT_135071 [Baudoinia panamericana UAMH 10762]|uniref:CFEM domain-containing protein n=1 Tax=Baudoinia panamericana (strain UAMH 10762) TaxID=717646 RepID=M2MYU5_BAUPA|nr:uncharacterized protein BAUCODRAFT_135071 [Baudoinia panamericana UAMH 10762]EMC91475.1 hypothetical protein BAUCODRAFT_135071 [Baudoinia panamericana UAMH 10762]
MRSFLLLSALASVAFSASIPGLPACAGSCVGTSFGSCSTLDVKCICSDSSLLSGLACCVSTSCNAADQNGTRSTTTPLPPQPSHPIPTNAPSAATINFANSLCQGYGVTNLPQSATCASTSSGAAASSTTAAAVAAASGSSSANSTISIPASLSSAFVSASAAASHASSSAVAAASSASRAASSTAASAASQTSSGAVATNVAGGMGAGLVLAGLIAAL